MIIDSRDGIIKALVIPHELFKIAHEREQRIFAKKRLIRISNMLTVISESRQYGILFDCDDSLNYFYQELESLLYNGNLTAIALEDETLQKRINHRENRSDRIYLKVMLKKSTKYPMIISDNKKINKFISTMKVQTELKDVYLFPISLSGEQLVKLITFSTGIKVCKQIINVDRLYLIKVLDKLLDKNFMAGLLEIYYGDEMDTLTRDHIVKTILIIRAKLLKTASTNVRIFTNIKEGRYKDMYNIYESDLGCI
jgi:hypothetical protein